jgi:hypothetical protein
MYAGIVANNASGMCCGVAHNTYNTLDHMRILFADGTLLDTADKGSCDAFLKVGIKEGGNQPFCAGVLLLCLVSCIPPCHWQPTVVRVHLETLCM